MENSPAVRKVIKVVRKVPVPVPKHYNTLNEMKLFDSALTTGLIADVFKLLYADKFIYCDCILYSYNGTYWKSDDDNLASLNTFVRMKHTWIEAHTDASFDTHSDRYHKTGQAIMIGRATDYGSFTRTRIEVDKARLEGLRLLRHESEVRIKLETAHPTDPKRVYEVYQQIRRMRGLLAEIQEWNPAALIKVEACQVSPIRGGEVDLGKGLAEIDYVDQAESVPVLLATPIIAAVNITVPSETPEEDRAFASHFFLWDRWRRHRQLYFKLPVER